VYLSKDNHIVGIHDETTKRTAGGRDIPVVDLTLEELRKLDAGGWKNAKYKGEKIPTLSELLASIPDGKRVFIEVKCGPEIVPALKRDIAASGKKPDQTAIISFSYEVCEASKQAMPQLAVYWIVGLKQDEQTKKWSPNLDDMIAKAKAAKLDGLDLGKAPIIDRAYASRIRNAGLGLYVWTVDDPAEAKRLIDAGVQGVTTNRPGWMREQLSLDK
jgi:glycerophosphoryl diester phosphodiesterase